VRFAIRDDDTCYYTQPEELEEVWGPILPYAPVSLAVIPFALRSNNRGDSERYYQGPDSGALQSNQALVQWLRGTLTSNRTSIMCHGVTHEYQRVDPRHFIPECIWKGPDRLAKELRRGRQHLESAVGVRIRTFVPPGNGISLASLRVLRPEFDRVLASVSLRRFQDSFQSLDYLWLAGRRFLHHVRDGIVDPFGGQVAGVEMRPSFGLNKSTEWAEIVRTLECCHRLGADFTVAVHYWEVKDRIRDHLYRLLDRASSLGFQFVTCDHLFDSGALDTVQLVPAPQFRRHSA
jgi:peptidoglycan/xylan/chitin deacetylase (PgdA/CDA1 family)